METNKGRMRMDKAPGILRDSKDEVKGALLARMDSKHFSAGIPRGSFGAPGTLSLQQRNWAFGSQGIPKKNLQAPHRDYTLTL